MSYIELTDNQSRVLIDAKQVAEAHKAAVVALRSFAGGIQWKHVHGQDYLVRVTNRRGGNKSLGARTEATEKIYAEFVSGKRNALDRLAHIENSRAEIAGMGRGVGINRVPNVVADILRTMDEFGLLGKCVQVIGTNALYGYESAAGVMFDAGLLATTDIDFMWDASSRLKLAIDDEEIRQAGVLAILKKADKSFEPLYQNGFRAVNKKGFAVDLVKALPNPPWRSDVAERISDNDLLPTEIISLKWLLSSPRFKSTVIAQNGIPAPMVSPDPRAFAIHKIWLSQQDDREPVKKNRDKNQAMSVATLVKEKLTYLKFGDKFEQMFPTALRSDSTIK
ncbi:MAG: GSU2403 family nucleotidyltransferase fold protein [Gallionella sp.]